MARSDMLAEGRLHDREIMANGRHAVLSQFLQLRRFILGT